MSRKCYVFQTFLVNCILTKKFTYCQSFRFSSNGGGANVTGGDVGWITFEQHKALVNQI